MSHLPLHQRPSLKSNSLPSTIMKKYILILTGAAILAGCEQKETTVTNPPAEKKETTIIKESPAPETKTETKTETNINVTSPAPSP